MKVFITGAGGFVGGRMVEILHQESGYTPVAGIRRWSTAARIGRLPVDIVQCDLKNPSQIRAALDGVDAVIHCATGPGDTNVVGTTNLLQACADTGVSKVVHLSTIDVYGNDTGTLTEDRSLKLTGSEYGDSKVGAEAVCQEFVDRGLQILILRPTIVYGPFSTLWVEEFAERLQVRPWPFPKELCSGLCNLVYVDDLVAAARLSLGVDGYSGEAMNINGPDRPTWFEYFTALNQSLGLPPIASASTGASRFAAMAMAPVRGAAKFALAHFGDSIMRLYQSSEISKRIMKRLEGAIRKAPTAGEFELYSKEISVPTEKAARILGYRPRVDMETGVGLSADWALSNGFVGGTPKW